MKQSEKRIHKYLAHAFGANGMNQRTAGSSHSLGPIAPMVEQHLCKVKVLGSNPSGSTCTIVGGVGYYSPTVRLDSGFTLDIQELVPTTILLATFCGSSMDSLHISMDS